MRKWSASAGCGQRDDGWERVREDAGANAAGTTGAPRCELLSCPAAAWAGWAASEQPAPAWRRRRHRGGGKQGQRIGSWLQRASDADRKTLLEQSTAADRLLVMVMAATESARARDGGWLTARPFFFPLSRPAPFALHRGGLVVTRGGRGGHLTNARSSARIPIMCPLLLTTSHLDARPRVAQKTRPRLARPRLDAELAELGRVSCLVLAQAAPAMAARPPARKPHHQGHDHDLARSAPDLRYCSSWIREQTSQAQRYLFPPGSPSRQ